MAHNKITIIGTEEQYEKAREYLLRKYNTGYYQDIDNGMNEADAYMKWGSHEDLGGADYVVLKEEKLTKEEYIAKYLTTYIIWFHDYGDTDLCNYLLDVRNCETNLDEIDVECLYLSEFIQRIKELPTDVNLMVADGHW